MSDLKTEERLRAILTGDCMDWPDSTEEQNREAHDRAALLDEVLEAARIEGRDSVLQKLRPRYKAASVRLWTLPLSITEQLWPGVMEKLWNE